MKLPNTGPFYDTVRALPVFELPMDDLKAPNLVTINAERLKSSFQGLSEIGQDKNSGGITRRAFSEADLKARNWLKAEAELSGLCCHEDMAGNIIISLEELRADRPLALCGSHIDSVANGGKYDGALGVLCGLEALRSLKECPKSACSSNPALIAFSDEEGRFGGMFGSQSFAGTLSREAFCAMQDEHGVYLSKILSELGYDTEVIATREQPEYDVSGYLELHIEQGPILDRESCPLGIVSSIAGLRRWRISFKGEANHAGTTPMNYRRDALNGLIDFRPKLDSLVKDTNFLDTVYTIGSLKLLPGAANVVPGEIVFTLDLRSPSEETLLNFERSIPRLTEEIAEQNKLQSETTLISSFAPVACSAKLQEYIKTSCDRNQVKWIHLISGAAHDAQQIGAIAPMAMVFVPSVNGKSHSPEELTEWRDIEVGAQVFAEALQSIAQG